MTQISQKGKKKTVPKATRKYKIQKEKQGREGKNNNGWIEQQAKPNARLKDGWVTQAVLSRLGDQKYSSELESEN